MSKCALLSRLCLLIFLVLCSLDDVTGLMTVQVNGLKVALYPMNVYGGIQPYKYLFEEQQQAEVVCSETRNGNGKLTLSYFNPNGCLLNKVDAVRTSSEDPKAIFQKKLTLADNNTYIDCNFNGVTCRIFIGIREYGLMVTLDDVEVIPKRMPTGELKIEHQYKYNCLRNVTVTCKKRYNELLGDVKFEHSRTCGKDCNFGNDFTVLKMTPSIKSTNIKLSTKLKDIVSCYIKNTALSARIEFIYEETKITHEDIRDEPRVLDTTTTSSQLSSNASFDKNNQNSTQPIEEKQLNPKIGLIVICLVGMFAAALLAGGIVLYRRRSGIAVAGKHVCENTDTGGDYDVPPELPRRAQAHGREYDFAYDRCYDNVITSSNVESRPKINVPFSCPQRRASTCSQDSDSHFYTEIDDFISKNAQRKKNIM